MAQRVRQRGRCDVTISEDRLRWRLGAGRRAATPTVSADSWSRLPVGSSHSTQRRLANQRPRERHPLPLTARQLGRPVVDALPQPHLVDQIEGFRALADLAIRIADEGGHQDVLEHRALRQQQVVLEDEPDAGVAEHRQRPLVRGANGSVPVQRHAAGSSAARARPATYSSVLLPLPDGPDDRGRVALFQREAETSERIASPPLGPWGTASLRFLTSSKVTHPAGPARASLRRHLEGARPEEEVDDVALRGVAAS